MYGESSCLIIGNKHAHLIKMPQIGKLVPDDTGICSTYVRGALKTSFQMLLNYAQQ